MDPLSAIKTIFKLGPSALIGLVIGGIFVVIIEPATIAGAAVLIIIGLLPCLIIGGLLKKRRNSKS